MANDDTPQRDELDALLSVRLRASGPSLVEAANEADDDLDDDTVLRYVDGVMGEDERIAFEAQLAERPALAARVGALAAALDDSGFGPQAPEPLARRAAQAAARYVFHFTEGVLGFLRGSTMPIGAELVSAVRSGTPAAPPAFFEFVSRHPSAQGDIDARLALEASPARAIDLQLELTHDGAPLDGIRVKLLRDGRPIDSVPTEHGRCRFTALAAAHYELELRKSGIEVGRIVLDIRGDGTA